MSPRPRRRSMASPSRWGTALTATTSAPAIIRSGRSTAPAYRVGGEPNVTLAAITDGTSNTAIWSEWVNGDLSKGNRRQAPDLHGAHRAQHEHAAGHAGGGLPRHRPPFYTAAGASPPGLGSEGGRLDAQQLRPGGVAIATPRHRTRGACFWSDETSSHTFYTLVGASSNHPGGVNVGMLDGSVRFIKDTVAPATWWGARDEGWWRGHQRGFVLRAIRGERERLISDSRHRETYPCRPFFQARMVDGSWLKWNPDKPLDISHSYNFSLAEVVGRGRRGATRRKSLVRGGLRLADPPRIR